VPPELPPTLICATRCHRMMAKMTPTTDDTGINTVGTSGSMTEKLASRFDVRINARNVARSARAAAQEPSSRRAGRRQAGRIARAGATHGRAHALGRPQCTRAKAYVASSACNTCGLARGAARPHDPCRVVSCPHARCLPWPRRVMGSRHLAFRSGMCDRERARAAASLVRGRQRASARAWRALSTGAPQGRGRVPTVGSARATSLTPAWGRGRGGGAWRCWRRRAR
jgi:hypothetical protein